MKVTQLVAMGAALIALASFLPAAAQDYSGYYTTLHAKEFQEDFTHDLYEKGNQLTTQTRARWPHKLDLAYGPDSKQKLDLYMPDGKFSRAPVLLFIHGGGFLEGDRAHYGFIARPYAPHGIITAVMSYRLTGTGTIYPGQEQDVKEAILWLHKNIAQYGGDPNVIYVTGHSAGAILSAEIGVDRKWLTQAGVDKEILRGIAPVSGPYDLRQNEEFYNYVPTREAQDKASPLLHITDPVSHCIVAFGSHNAEEDSYSVSARAFVRELRRHGVHAEELLLAGKGHIATAMALGTPGSTLAQAVLKMVGSEAGHVENGHPRAH